MGKGPGIRKKTSRQHKAAVEIASKRRELSKLLKREGFEGVPLDKKVPTKPEDQVDSSVEAVSEQPKTKEERDRERKQKLEDRKFRAAKLMKRTRKGQPLMKNLIGDLVGKLSKDA